MQKIFGTNELYQDYKSMVAITRKDYENSGTRNTKQPQPNYHKNT